MTRLFLLAAGLLVSVSAYADTKISESGSADANGEVEISNVSGTVEVTGWDREQVEVTGTLGSGAERLEFVPDGGHTLIKVVLPKRSNRSKGSDLYVRVPHGSSLSVTTVSADIEVTGVDGAQRLQAVSGDIDTAVSSDDVEVKTVSGDIDVEGSGSMLLLGVTTVSGDADIDDVGGEIVVASVSGDVDVVGTQVERARLKTTSGDLSLSADILEGARVDMDSINGDLSLEFTGKVHAEFDIETFNGDIDTCFGPDPVRTSKYAPGWELRFEEGNGSGRVRIETLNGTIFVCRD